MLHVEKTINYYTSNTWFAYNTIIIEKYVKGHLCPYTAICIIAIMLMLLNNIVGYSIILMFIYVNLSLKILF